MQDAGGIMLTIWEITDPNPDPVNETQRFYRWTFESAYHFMTSKIGYVHQGNCRRRGLEWVQKHGYGVPKIKYAERTNTEFIT
jgi:hypothetical protein